jgi:uncharacterized protein (TIGR03086 family)
VFDLTPAADVTRGIVAAVRDDQLDGPTPCTDWRVADLLAHVHEFATVFTCNARKAPLPRLGGLPDDWRAVVPRRLDELALAWQDESAWRGRVSAGGVEMSAEENAVVAVEELVVHGWDLARATGQELPVEPQTLGEVERFLAVFADQLAGGQGPYGPAVPAPPHASRLDRYLCAAGRDPGWSPTR